MIKNNRVGQKQNLFSILFLIVLFCVGIFGGRGVEAATSTVRGAAWFGDFYKYVYFDCLDDITGDRLDVLGNLSGSGMYSPPEDKFHFFATPCVGLVHHVSIDSNNNFSGQAWNYSLGLINFTGSDNPPDGGASRNSNCDASCTPSTQCYACYKPSTQKVYGWARSEGGTWVRLDGTSTLPVAIQDWDTNNSVLVGHNIKAGDFVGIGSSSGGDLSFNCENEIGGNISNCAVRNYKVYISNLQIGHLSASEWSPAQACYGPARSATLRWAKKSGQQTAYEVVVNNHNTFSTSTADYVCWSGKKISAVAAKYDLPNSDPTCNTLLYDKEYYWWVRLYDENDLPTGWYKFGGTTDGHNGLTDTITDLGITYTTPNEKTFKTYKHEFPSPYFSWSPADVLVSATTTFISASQYYTIAQPNTPQANCVGGSCLATWSTTDLGALITATTSPTSTDIFFLQATGTRVNFVIRDWENYTCSTSTVLRINYGLPIWREVKAE